MKTWFQNLSFLLASVLGAAAESNAVVAPDAGTMTSSNLVQGAGSVTNQAEIERRFQSQLDLASFQRHTKCPALAVQTLVSILETNAPPEFKRKALFDLALATQDNNDFVKAQQVYAQYLQRYPEDLHAPEVLLRQGLLFRQMGVTDLAQGNRINKVDVPRYQGGKRLLGATSGIFPHQRHVIGNHSIQYIYTGRQR